jgi:hypothetical protein
MKSWEISSRAWLERQQDFAFFEPRAKNPDIQRETAVLRVSTRPKIGT